MAYNMRKNQITPIKILEYNNERQKVEFIDVLTTYKELRFTRSWGGVGSFTIKINANKPKANELITGRFIQIGNDKNKQGIIQDINRNLNVTDSGVIENNIIVSGVELKGLLSYSLTVPNVGIDSAVFPQEGDTTSENFYFMLDAQNQIINAAVLDYYGTGTTHEVFDSKETFFGTGYDWHETEEDYWTIYGEEGGVYDVTAVDEDHPFETLPDPISIINEELIGEDGDFKLNSEAENWNDIHDLDGELYGISDIRVANNRLRAELHDPETFLHGTYYPLEVENGHDYYILFTFQQSDPHDPEEGTPVPPRYEGIGGTYEFENNSQTQKIRITGTATSTGTINNKIMRTGNEYYEFFNVWNVRIYDLTELKNLGYIEGTTTEELKESFDSILSADYEMGELIARIYFDSEDIYRYYKLTYPHWKTEEIMREIVDANRKNNILYFQNIPELELEELPEDHEYRGIDHEYEAFRFKRVSDVLEYLSNSSGLGWNIVAENARLVFKVFKSKDRSTEQSKNNTVVFSFNRGNLRNVEYSEKTMNTYNQLIIAGGGDGTERDLLVVGDFYQRGMNSRLGFADARDVSTMEGLETRAKEKIVEKGPTQAIKVVGFSKKILVKLGEDYEIGDKVTVRIDEWGLTLHIRVLSVTERQTLNNAGTVEFEFGTKHLTLENLLKQNFDEIQNEIIK